MTKDYKYIHNKECLLKDWGKSIRFGKYFIEWYDEDDEEVSEIFDTHAILTELLLSFKLHKSFICYILLIM